jgi:hypothetical protein
MDRQDIDALLIGALYGELTPADEARLAAHLESHPTDRGALDDLKVARQAVLDSRIFAVQLEPPQSVSALLLQEAHRRAPKRVAAAEEKESWFARFTRSFMAHPAMAAAAMLVLVMGGAGIVWMKKGDQLASQEYSQASSDRSAQAAPTTVSATPAPEPVLPEGNAAVAAGSAYSADLYEGDLQGADQGKLADGKSSEEQLAQMQREVAGKQAEVERSRAEVSKSKRVTSSIEVDTDRAPKELEARKADSPADDSITADKAAATKPAPKPAASGGGGAATYGGTGTAAGVAPGRAATGDSLHLDASGETANAVSGAGYSQPPPSTAAPNAGPAAAKKQASPAPTTTTTTAAKPTATPTTKTAAPATTPKAGAKVAADPKPAAPGTKAPPPPPVKPADAPASVAAAPSAPEPAPQAPTKEAPAKNEAKKDSGSTLLAWAKGEHQRAIGLAKGGNCRAAAQIALSVSNRASGYYSQYMATDRSLKACAQYINAERDKEAERTQKARASKRVNADEPASATTK